MEDKGLSLAVHYRLCGDKAEAKSRILAVARQLDDARVIGGKQVVNVVRAGAPHKGDVIQAERRRLGCTCMLFVGDDENDEDAFAADPRTMSVRVGKKQDSHARFFLKAQAEVDRLLEALVELRVDAAKAACPAASGLR